MSNVNLELWCTVDNRNTDIVIGHVSEILSRIFLGRFIYNISRNFNIFPLNVDC
jgi:hypothetical protein